MVRNRAERVYLTAERKLTAGLHDARITSTDVAGPFRRCSLLLQINAVTARIAFELSPQGGDRGDATAFLERLVKLTGLPKLPSDSSEFHGKTIGLRIDRGRFINIESPRPQKPQPKETDQ